ncbi:MAG: TolC family protein [Cytophagales bacterium]|nr:TolC family protein [Cytophagales bacterium]
MIRSYLLLFGLFFGLGCMAQNSENVKKWTLQECVDQAWEKNLTLQLSKLTVRDQEVNVRQAKAERYPTLNSGANYGFNWGRGIDPTTNQFISQRVGFTGFSANTGVVLFAGFQRNNIIRRGMVDLNASKKDLEDARNDIALNVASLYLNVIFNKELLNNNLTQLASTRQQLERTRALVNAGSLPISNLLDLQSQLATNEVNVINAENALNLSLLDLKQALLIPAGETFDIVVPDLEVDQEAIVGLDIEEIYRGSLAVQPDIKSADLNIESAARAEDIAKGAMYPRLSLNGSLGSNYSDAVDNERNLIDGTREVIEPIGFVENTNEVVLTRRTVPNVVGTDNNYSVTEQFDDNLNQSLSLNVSIPIFNGLATRSDIQRSKIQKQMAEINARQVRQTLRQVIEQAYYDAVAASKNYEAALKQVESLEESYRVAKQQYDLGVINFVDYQVAENNLFQARSDLVRNKYDLIFRIKILDFYQGKTITF